MKKKTSTLAMNYTLFLILLLSSGFFGGIMSQVIYYSAFILPFAIVMLFSKKEESFDYIRLSREGIKTTLPIIAPTVSLIMLVSFLTSLLIGSITGKTNSVDVGDSFVFAILNYALAPAVLEEMLFRYLPLRLLGSYSKRWTVLLSAFFFAFVHHNFFSIPYAFIAGVIFMTVDIATNSIIPSAIIHFVNNALSVGMMFYGENRMFAPVMYSIVGGLTLISILFIVFKRKEYRKILSSAFEAGEKPEIPLEMLLFAGLSIFLAVISII